MQSNDCQGMGILQVFAPSGRHEYRNRELVKGEPFRIT